MTKVIIYNNEEGNVALMTPVLKDINPATGKVFTIEEVAAKDVPSGTEYKIVETSTLPDDLTFFDAWKRSGETVSEDVTQSKAIAHATRREKRTAEFEPHDKTISLNIPVSDTSAAETARVAIRTKYATMQTNIDNATDIAGIKTALGG